MYAAIVVPTHRSCGFCTLIKYNFKQCLCARTMSVLQCLETWGHTESPHSVCTKGFASCGQVSFVIHAGGIPTQKLPAAYIQHEVFEVFFIGGLVTSVPSMLQTRDIPHQSLGPDRGKQLGNISEKSHTSCLSATL